MLIGFGEFHLKLVCLLALLCRDVETRARVLPYHHDHLRAGVAVVARPVGQYRLRWQTLSSIRWEYAKALKVFRLVAVAVAAVEVAEMSLSQLGSR